jgi:hypothetical protein
MEKILRYEEKLRFRCPAVLYPNILAGRWKDEYEKEKQNEKRRQDLTARTVNGGG